MSEKELIGGKYEMMERLGKGGAGSVYRIRDVRLDKVWAAKRVKKENPGMEERVLGRVDGSLFPRIVDVVEEENCRYLVMDWIEGETLAQKLEKRGSFPEKEVAEMGMEICDALKALHEMQPPLLYLDCKPSNIMVDQDGKLWLIDFGSAVEWKEMDAVPIAASPGYAAPEQLAGPGGSRRVDVRSDVFGLGRTLYALLGGPDPARPPYGACSIGSCKQEVSEGMAAIVEKCTQKGPERRFQTIQAVQEELRLFLEGEERVHPAGIFRQLVTGMLLLMTAWRAWAFYKMVSAPQPGTKEALEALGWLAAAACAAVGWQKGIAEGHRGSKRICEPVYSIVRTEKKPGRWMGMLLIGLLSVLLVSGRAQAQEKQSSFPVVLRDAQLRKLLVRDGAVLRAESPVYMEINPSFFETEEELEITVTARGRDSGRIYEYRLGYCPVRDEE